MTQLLNKNKLVAIILCFTMLFSITSGIFTEAFAADEENTAYMIYDVTDGGDITLPHGQKAMLTAVGGMQWQIYINDADMWVNIDGARGSALEISYPLVASTLTDRGTGELRCLLEDGTYSGIVNLVVDFKDDSSMFPKVEEQEVIVLTQPEVIMTTTESALQYESTTGSELEYEVTTGSEIEYVEKPSLFSALFRLTKAAEPSTYNVIINYKFHGKNTIVTDPYTEIYAAGSSVEKHIVKSPQVVGYEAAPASVEIGPYDAIDEDKIFTVEYYPAEVNFTIEHYYQNLTDDKYTLADSETAKGYTGAPVGEGLADTPNGFYALLYNTDEAIAADGSSVVEIYYDRNYYLMNFDMDGGYGTEPIYARYDAELGTIPAPTKEGYKFMGWKLVKENNTTYTPSDEKIATVPGKMPAANRTYKAVWKENPNAKVTVVYWGENADDEEYSYLGSGELMAKPGTTITYNTQNMVCGLETHQHDATCKYDCGIEAHSHIASCYKFICKKEEHPAHVDDCYTCNVENHTHSKACYANVGSSVSSTVAYWLPDNPKEGQVYDGRYGNYIYIKGIWYEYSGSMSSNIASTICGKTEQTHTHTSACIGCGKEIHTHTAYNGECYDLTCTKTYHVHTADCGYSCGKYAHAHGEECYLDTSHLDPDILDIDLYTYVDSDEVTVAADGSTVMNVYFDRKTFTLHFRKKNSSSDNYGTITAKWGANIETEFANVCKKAGYQSWSENRDASDPWTNYIAIMPQSNKTYYSYTGSGNNVWRMTYYTETLTDNEYAVAFTVDLYRSNTTTVSKEEFLELKGFTFNSDKSTKTGSSTNGAKFYYERNSYTLDFNNGKDITKSESVKYQAPLSSYESYTPSAPNLYEAGTVTFGGWYLNPQCTGEEYDLSTHTMPASNMILYAKWVPVSRTVEFYESADAIASGNKLDGYNDITVLHGNYAPAVNDPSNGEYTFIGWFYMEDGVEKAFNFVNMPVTKDMKVYPKWSSNRMMAYTIRYAVENGDGTLTYIAPDETGFALATTMKTFEAKTGTELNVGYQSGYYPLTSSHSITLSIDNPAENEYTFIYVPREELPYTVKYLEVGTEKVLHTQKEAVTKSAVITETFVTITNEDGTPAGYMPDAYQKRLVLSANTAENVIIFWYVKDTVNAPVQVIHYVQDAAGDGYTLYRELPGLKGEIGEEFETNVLTIDGYTFNHATENKTAISGVTSSTAKVTGTVTEGGLILELYYNRNLYPYTFNFLEFGTETQLADPVTGSARHGAQVIQDPKNITDYTCITGSSKKSIIIQKDTTGASNVETFYYKENEVDIEYIPVGPDGVLEQTNDIGTVTLDKESVKVKTGKVIGSTAEAKAGYRFVGWYAEPACQTLISENAKYVPAKVNDRNVAGKYYAKFVVDVTDLTIQKSGAADANDTFIFRVTGDGVDLTVSLKGNASITIADLTIGSYTVTEVTSWSKRYTPEKATQTIALQADPEENVLVFKNSLKDKWLTFEAFARNIFNK